MKRSLLLVLATMLCAVPAQAQVVFSDSNFRDADWTSTVMTFNTPGSGGSTSHASTGGNPGEHRAIQSLSCQTNNPCKAMMIEIMTATTFDPSTQGAIASLNYQEDQLCASADGCVGGGQNWFPVCLQNGTFYVYNSFTPTGVLNTWTTQSVTGLTEADFTEVDLSAFGMINPASNPDFSAAGAPIQFGYARANSLNSARVGRIDNWSISIVQTPVVIESRSWGYAKSLYR